ncbi:hypothetical protein ACLKA6_011639 [Drosophila palustris]
MSVDNSRCETILRPITASCPHVVNSATAAAAATLIPTRRLVSPVLLPPLGRPLSLLSSTSCRALESDVFLTSQKDICQIMDGECRTGPERNNINDNEKKCW